jgi:hypothetical protein
MNEDIPGLHNNDTTIPALNNPYSNSIHDPYNVGPSLPPPPPLQRRRRINSPFVIVILVLVLLSVSGIFTGQYLYRAHSQMASPTPRLVSDAPYNAKDIYYAFEQAGLVDGHFSYDGYWCKTCTYTPEGGSIAWGVNASTTAEIATFAYPYEVSADYTTLAEHKYPGYVVKDCLLFYHGPFLPQVQDYLRVMYNKCR